MIQNINTKYSSKIHYVQRCTNTNNILCTKCLLKYFVQSAIITTETEQETATGSHTRNARRQARSTLNVTVLQLNNSGIIKRRKSNRQTKRKTRHITAKIN